MNERQAMGPGALMQMMQGHHVSAVLSAGIDLDVFGAIEKGAKNTDAIAKAIGAPERSTRILVDALVALGLVDKHDGVYGLSPLASTHLVREKPMYMGGMSNIFGHPIMWQGLAHLTDAVKAGGTVLPEHAETPRHPFWEVFARSTVAMAMPSAMAVHKVMGPWLAKRERPTMLDVAAGSGAFAYTMVKENPTLRATLLDWPNVLAETKKWQPRLGADAGRVDYVEGDLFEVAYGGPYDMVLLSHVFHHFEPQVCEKLMARAAAALKPGGRVVIHDFLTDGDNPAARMFAVTMLNWTKKGEAFASDDYRRWCDKSGLRSFEVHPCEGLPTTIVVAEKA